MRLISMYTTPLRETRAYTRADQTCSRSFARSWPVVSARKNNERTRLRGLLLARLVSAGSRTARVPFLRRDRPGGTGVSVTAVFTTAAEDSRSARLIICATRPSARFTPSDSGAGVVPRSLSSGKFRAPRWFRLRGKLLPRL